MSNVLENWAYYETCVWNLWADIHTHVLTRRGVFYKVIPARPPRENGSLTKFDRLEKHTDMQFFSNDFFRKTHVYIAMVIITLD